MRLTVLGKSPSWQDAGGACSGYLVEEEGTAVLLDCGNGVFSNLRLQRHYTSVDAVVLSHLHADHFLDLVPYAYALTYGPRQRRAADGGPGASAPARPALWAPPGARELFRRVVGAWGSEELIERAFELHAYDPEARLEIGPLALSFRAVPHFTETYAIRLDSRDGGCIAYGADTGPAAELTDFARGCGVLLMEATLPRPDGEAPRGHLTPAEAGDHARRAAAARLVLVHISDELDLERARREAADAFGGPVEVAREGAAYEV
jgi:ribonuclease BN (tRNA processing enzyme)